MNSNIQTYKHTNIQTYYKYTNIIDINIKQYKYKHMAQYIIHMAYTYTNTYTL